MNEAIKRAARPGATASYVISEDTDFISSSHQILLSDPTNSALYFSALLSNPPILVGGGYYGGIVGLLLLVTPQFQSVNQRSIDGLSTETTIITVEQGNLYLRAVAVHVDAILEEWNCGKISNRNVEDISKALGFAAYICSQKSRSLISSSGILPALAKLIIGYQRHKAFLLSSASNTRKSSTSSTAATTTTQSQEQTESPMARNFLTSVHPEFLQIAILAGHYRLASIFVQRHPVHAIDQHSCHQNSTNLNDENVAFAANNRVSNINMIGSSKKSKSTPLLSPESFLRYFYYLGMVHLGCDDYTSALSAFDICLKVPATMISAIVIAARKKMILARCLALALDDEEEYLSFSSTSPYAKKKSAARRSREGSGGDDGMKKVFCPLTRTIMELPLGVSPKVTIFLQEAERLSHDYDTGNQDDASVLAPLWPSGTNTPPSKTNSNNNTSAHGMPYYHLLVASFAKCDIPSMLKLLQTGGGVIVPSSSTNTSANIGNDIGILKRDGNLGLAQRLLPAMKHRLIQKMGKIYEAVSLDKFNQKLGIFGGVAIDASESNTLMAEDWLMHLALKQREESKYSSSFQTPLLEFTIDMQNSIVHFFQDGNEDDGHGNDGAETKFDSGGLARDDAQTKLANRIVTCMDLAERVTHLDVALATSAKYQAKVMIDSGGGNGGGGGEDEVGEEGGGGPRSVMDYYTHGIP
eukprot:CAMPEP_0198249298 /NCGR_PEP_ID=MMETSP1447-20131203/865_1 /TAXON_ID=420782 /ORGANISM="Chaetoceros dichaeta, Strain CCMP1751" /LENGTH=696 /DNA_ID=CAMNT_0043933903 /DNA_START=13 /DNA_END=2103 /DNA_ORIENTATION=+